MQGRTSARERKGECSAGFGRAPGRADGEQNRRETPESPKRRLRLADRLRGWSAWVAIHQLSAAPARHSARIQPCCAPPLDDRPPIRMRIRPDAVCVRHQQPPHCHVRSPPSLRFGSSLCHRPLRSVALLPPPLPASAMCSNRLAPILVSAAGRPSSNLRFFYSRGRAHTGHTTAAGEQAALHHPTIAACTRSKKEAARSAPPLAAAARRCAGCSSDLVDVAASTGGAALVTGVTRDTWRTTTTTR